MTDKEPLFEGTVTELLTQWFNTAVDKHWLDRGNRRITVYPAPKAWEKIVKQNASVKQNGQTTSNGS